MRALKDSSSIRQSFVRCHSVAGGTSAFDFSWLTNPGNTIPPKYLNSDTGSQRAHKNKSPTRYHHGHKVSVCVWTPENVFQCTLNHQYNIWTVHTTNVNVMFKNGHDMMISWATKFQGLRYVSTFFLKLRLNVKNEMMLKTLRCRRSAQLKEYVLKMKYSPYAESGESALLFCLDRELAPKLQQEGAAA